MFPLTPLSQLPKYKTYNFPKKNKKENKNKCRKNLPKNLDDNP
jgi:hypothetical protein